MSFETIKADIKKLSERKFQIIAKAEAENRETNKKENVLIGELEGAIEGLHAELEKPEKPLTFVGPGGNYAVTSDGRRIRMLAKGEKFTSIVPQTHADANWDLGDFVRSNLGIKGIAESVVSSPATVPLLIGAQIIDDVRERARIVQAGARTIPLTGPTNLCRIDSDPTVVQHDEGTDDITATLPTLTPVSLNPETLAALVPISFELAQDSKNLDSALRTSLSGAFALKLDQLGVATILADGTIPTSGESENCATWAGTMAAVTSALVADQDIPKALIASAEDFGARAVEVASTAGSWLGAPPVLANMLDLPSGGMAEGTAVFGNFAAGVAVAMRQDLVLEVIRFGKPGSASHLLVATMRAEIFVLQPKALYIQATSVT